MGNKYLPSLEAAGHNIFQYFLVSAVQAVQVCTIGEVLEYLKLSFLQSRLITSAFPPTTPAHLLHLNVAWIEATCQAGMETHLGWNREWH